LEADRLVVEDRIEGMFGTATAFLHFAPGTEPRLETEGFRARWEDGVYAPEFGVQVPNGVWIGEFERSEGRVTILF
jgi:hypothetical protein